LKGKEVDEQNVEIINVDYNTKFDIKEAKRLNTGIYTIIATNEHVRTLNSNIKFDKLNKMKLI
jgi:hypothetical protein